MTYKVRSLQLLWLKFAIFSTPKGGKWDSDVYKALAPANVQITNICEFFRIGFCSVKRKYSEKPWGNFTDNYGGGGLSSRRRPAYLRYSTETIKLLNAE
jgi:hypothetical protein